MSETHTDERYDWNPAERGKGMSALIALLGLWMIVAAVWITPIAAQFWNDVVVGVLLVGLGGYNYYRRADETAGSVGVASLVALLGLWLIASPFVLETGATVTDATANLAFWNHVVVGLIALAIGAYSAYEASNRAEMASPLRR